MLKSVWKQTVMDDFVYLIFNGSSPLNLLSLGNETQLLILMQGQACDSLNRRWTRFWLIIFSLIVEATCICMGIHVPWIDGTSPKTAYWNVFYFHCGSRNSNQVTRMGSKQHWCKPGFTTKYYLADNIFLISKMKESQGVFKWTR